MEYKWIMYPYKMIIILLISCNTNQFIRQCIIDLYFLPVAININTFWNWHNVDAKYVFLFMEYLLTFIWVFGRCIWLFWRPRNICLKYFFLPDFKQSPVLSCVCLAFIHKTNILFPWEAGNWLISSDYNINDFTSTC